MANLSYCRFENTLADLRDCQNHMDDEPSNESERKAKERLIALCKQIAADYEGEA